MLSSYFPGFADAKGSVITFYTDEIEIEFVVQSIQIRKMNRAEHEEAAVPTVFFKARDFATLAVGIHEPECGDIFFLAWGVFGGSGKKK